MTEAQRAARGRQADREWVELEAAFAKLREAILNNLAETSPSQPEKVLKLHMAAQNLAGVKQALMLVINDGVMAEHAIASAGLTRPN